MQGADRQTFPRYLLIPTLQSLQRCGRCTATSVPPLHQPFLPRSLLQGTKSHDLLLSDLCHRHHYHSSLSAETGSCLPPIAFLPRCPTALCLSPLPFGLVIVLLQPSYGSGEREREGYWPKAKSFLGRSISFRTRAPRRPRWARTNASLHSAVAVGAPFLRGR